MLISRGCESGPETFYTYLIESPVTILTEILQICKINAIKAYAGSDYFICAADACL